LVVVGSTESRNPAIEVELPSGAPGSPYPYTGLDETTFIVGDWQILMRVDQVQSVCGNVPPTYMNRILPVLSGEATLLPNAP
jgi:hypothetical protein